MKIHASIIALLLVAGCSAGPNDASSASRDESSSSQTAANTPSTEPTPKRSSAPPRDTPTPTREVIEHWNVGDSISMPSADVTVKTLEEREQIEKSSNFDDGSYLYEPREGERLWYVDMEWTNNAPEVVSKECHGPYSMQIHAFDINGNEMMMVDQPGYIEGQECSTGLMTGQTGRWQTAFRSLDAEFGWLIFDDFEGAVEFVTLDPHLELSFDPAG